MRQKPFWYRKLAGSWTKRSRSRLTFTLLLAEWGSKIWSISPFPLSIFTLLPAERGSTIWSLSLVNCTWPSVPALELYTITSRMRKHNLKYYSAPRDSDQDHDMSFRSEARYSLYIFRFPALDLYTITGRMRKQNLKTDPVLIDPNRIHIIRFHLSTVPRASHSHSGPLHYYRQNEEAQSEVLFSTERFRLK